MKKQFCILAAAVAASLAGGSALALPPAGPFTVQLTISGSSAFEGALENELSRVGSTICNNATFNKFQSNTNDFRAYTCNLAAGAVTPGGGETAVIYYRGEGGSVVGLKPLLTTGPQILRLQLSSCAFNAATTGTLTTNACTTAGYNAVNDTATGGLEKAVSQLGFADEEPLLFTGENYPNAATFAFLQPVLTATERATLNTAAVAVVGQAFGIYVNGQNAELGAVGNLSKTVLSNVFKGTYSDWNFVPTVNGNTVTTTSLPIKLCRREAGSGTQVATSLFFNSLNGFASEASPGNLSLGSGGGGVQENASTGAMRTCIDGNQGAIGYISSEADAGNRKQIRIDGQGGATGNNLGPLIAIGQYDFWYEMTGIKRPGLAGTASTLASKLISVTQSQVSGPSSPNVAFLSPFNAAQYPLVTPAGKQPVSCVRRSKVSTSAALWQC
jgi:ABC-type phosphate transport system substrate-binding protein